MAYPTTLAIGDAHMPWVSLRTLARVYDAIETIKPKNIVQLGDLYDMYSWSRFPRTQMLMTPLQEIQKGRAQAERFWANVRKRAPRAKLFQVKGNHDARPYKRVLEQMPEAEPLMALDQLWLFDRVETMKDDREDLVIRDVSYLHGFRGHGQHVLHIRRKCVVGHLHRGGIVYVRNGQECLWECNAGFIANPHAKPLGYAPLRRYNNQTQGFAIIDELGPRFVHLPNP